MTSIPSALLSVGGLRGAAIVTVAGRVEMLVADGPADIDAGSECTPQTRFQISSISKQFAAIAALRLVESGELDLAEPVARWFPSAPQQWQRVTLHHLLTHTAGVRHWDNAAGLDPSQPMGHAERLSRILQAPLVSEPGSCWRYSSPGYILCGDIVAQASGRPYVHVLTEQVLDPLGLTATAVSACPKGPTARGYRNGAPVTPWDLSDMPGTGDVWSTVGDLAQFITAVHAGDLIGPGSLREMLIPHVALPDDQASHHGIAECDSFGYAQFIGRIDGHTAYLHPGDTPGYQSLGVWLPDQQACMIILCNDEASDINSLLAQLTSVALRHDR